MDRNTIVRISLSPTEGGACTDEVHEIDLQTLRRRCFIHLSAMMLQDSSYAKLPVPAIWIDGTGTPIKVVWYASEAGRLRRGSDYLLTATALERAGNDYIKEIFRTYPEKFGPFLAGALPRKALIDKSESNLGWMWLALQQFDWNFAV